MTCFTEKIPNGVSKTTRLPETINIMKKYNVPVPVPAVEIHKPSAMTDTAADIILAAFLFPLMYCCSKPGEVNFTFPEVW